jgi:hypothetical protein
MAKNATLLTLGTDLQEICIPKFDLSVWNNMAREYKQAWLGEIKRRLGLIKTIVKGTDHESGLNKFAKGVFSDTTLVPTAIDTVYFTQFGINDHFQSNYVGQPEWLSAKALVEVAPVLRRSPEKSLDMRISVHSHGGKWVALNNRGFALHCLAGLCPKRLAPTPELKSEEAKRFNVTQASLKFNYSGSVPDDRRKCTEWEATIPSSVIGVISGRNGVDVVCTIKGTWNQDAGNEKVFNLLTHQSPATKEAAESKTEGKK